MSRELPNFAVNAQVTKLSILWYTKYEDNNPMWTVSIQQKLDVVTVL